MAILSPAGRRSNSPAASLVHRTPESSIPHRRRGTGTSFAPGSRASGAAPARFFARAWESRPARGGGLVARSRPSQVRCPPVPRSDPGKIKIVIHVCRTPISPDEEHVQGHAQRREHTKQKTRGLPSTPFRACVSPRRRNEKGPEAPEPRRVAISRAEAHCPIWRSWSTGGVGSRRAPARREAQLIVDRGAGSLLINLPTQDLGSRPSETAGRHKSHRLETSRNKLSGTTAARGLDHRLLSRIIDQSPRAHQELVEPSRWMRFAPGCRRSSQW